MYSRVTKKNNRFYSLLKTYGTFSPYCLSEDISQAYVLRSLNIPAYVIGYEHKALYDIIFRDINRPKTIVNIIRGTLFNEEMRMITHEEAKRRIIEYGGDVFVKVASYSSQGRGVELMSNEDASNIDSVIAVFGEDVVMQQSVKQSKITSRFSRRSLNTFRVSTLLLNGKCTLCTILFRCGVSDALVDNGMMGNIMVGVDANGKFQEYGYDKCMRKYYESDTGIPFANVQIQQVQNLVEFAINNHETHLPHAGFIGWDLALDEQNSPILIEINVFQPGIYIEQLATHQPIFGNRTEEVIEWVKNHRPRLTSILANGYY